MKGMHRKFGRDWMNFEMQTTLLNTYLPKLIATILKALREQLKENDQLNAVEVGICQKTLCWLRDVKRLIGYNPKVSMRLFNCKSAKMQA